MNLRRAPFARSRRRNNAARSRRYSWAALLVAVSGSACSLNNPSVVVAPGDRDSTINLPLDAARADQGRPDSEEVAVESGVPVDAMDASPGSMDVRDESPVTVDVMDVPVRVDTGPCSSGPDTDSDGLVDACDRCPVDNPDDSDGDSVCSSADRCPGFDDRVDGDGDTVPDGCDTWPCGPSPTVPASVVNAQITITGFSFSTGGRTAVVAAAASVTMTFSYSIINTRSSGAIDQIEIGLVPGARIYCAYDGIPGGMQRTGTSTRTFAAPTASGVYDVRVGYGQDYSCNYGGRTNWQQGAPGAGSTIGKLCVR